MRTKLIWIVNLIVALFFSTVFAIPKYTADQDHTNIGFSVRHMVISNVKGEFTDYSIEFKFDENDLQNSHLKAIMKTASIETGNEKRDNHLRSNDFLAVDKYPEITFISNRIKKLNGKYIAEGELTIRGVTKKIELPFEILGKVRDPYGNIRIGAEAQLTINRKDFNVNWSKTLDNGGLIAGDEVNIQLDIEMIQQ